MDKKVKEYIEKQPSPQKEVIKEIRAIFIKTLPNPEEKSAWGAITYARGKFYIAAMKTRVHVGFAVGGLSKDEIKFFEGSGKSMRHIKIDSPDEIDQKNLVKLIKLVYKKTDCKPC